MSKRSGSGNASASRFAGRVGMMTPSPARMRTPPISTSSRAIRNGPVSVIDRKRSSSSTAAGVRSGSAASSFSCSGSESRVSTDREIIAALEACPAICSNCTRLASSNRSAAPPRSRRDRSIWRLRKSSAGFSSLAAMTASRWAWSPSAAARCSSSVRASRSIFSVLRSMVSRSSAGTPRNVSSTSVGTGFARWATKSTGRSGCASNRSIAVSTMRWMRGFIALILRTENSLSTARRAWECSGPSMFTRNGEK